MGVQRVYYLILPGESQPQKVPGHPRMPEQICAMLHCTEWNLEQMRDDVHVMICDKEAYKKNLQVNALATAYFKKSWPLKFQEHTIKGPALIVPADSIDI